MTRTVEITLYQYDELSEKAKAKAIEAWRELTASDDDYAEPVIEEAVRFGLMLGIEIAERPVRSQPAGLGIKEPAILWSGFSSQGDGACFEGSYAYAKGALDALKAEAPLDERLHAVAVRLAVLQRRYFYGLTATVKHSGHYYHEYCTDIDIETRDGRGVTEADEKELKDCLREFMRWTYRELESAYWGATEDDVIADNIRANETEFEADGSIADH